MKSLRKWGMGCLVFFILSLFLSTWCSVFAFNSSGNITIRVGYFDYEGFLEQDENGNFFGYGYEYLEEISTYTGWKYEFIFGTWEECLSRLSEGKIDLLCTAQYTTERERIFDYAKYESGTEYAALLVAENNNEIYYNDFASFNGLKIAMLKNSYQNSLLEKYAEENHFSYQPLYFDSMKEASASLYDGRSDALLTGSLRRSRGEKIVAKFSPTPFYFITTKGNYGIVNELNKAMGDIQTIDVGYNAKLMTKYYGGNSAAPVAYTKRESEYIQKHPTLRVAYNESWMPIEYYDAYSKQFSGAASGILHLISEKCGIQFTYIPAQNEEGTLQKVKDGEADLICAFSKQHLQDARQDDIFLTKSYFNVPLTLSQLSDIPPDQIKTIAIPQYCSYLLENAKELAPDAEILFYSDTKACIQAVYDRKADAVFENIYILDQYRRNSGYGNLEPILSTRIDYPICIGVSAQQDTVLVSILNKAISQLDSKELNESLITNTMNPNHYHFTTMIRQFILPTVFLFLLILVAVIIRSKKKIERYAFVDPITKHANQTRFDLLAPRLLQNKESENYAVISFDIDKFKLVNNMHSFDTGNQILKAISDLLARETSQNELFCRASSDNFILLLNAHNQDILQPRLYSLICKILEIPHSIDIDFQFSVSCGVYLLKAQEKDIHSAVGWANLARKKAKANPQKWIVYYDDTMREKAMKEQDIENRMETALQNKEFEVYYQPKFRTSDERIAGTEALVRWKPKDGSMIFPNDFIPLFESNGFIIKLDQYVFERVCSNLRGWLDDGIKPCPVSVNLSRVHLNQPKFFARYLEIMEQYLIPPYLIEIELTESTMLENQEQMVTIMHELKKGGLAVSMDDFGTGFSSLNLLKDMPIDYLKIDREFFNISSNSERGKNVIQSVVYMAHQLNITVIAEGVETLEQVRFLKEIECDIIQGYYFSKPLPKGEFEKYLYHPQKALHK